jgi:uncharacterized protein with NAD-binding domain and iron-sulfur cluster
VLATLRRHDIVVHLQLFQQCYFELDGGNRWQFNFWNHIHNVNEFTKTVRPGIPPEDHGRRRTRRHCPPTFIS